MAGYAGLHPPYNSTCESRGRIRGGNAEVANLMKALFFGKVAADTAEGIRSELPASLEPVIVSDPQDLLRTPEHAAEADILVSNHWRAEYPSAPNVRLVQSVATGVDLFDLAALPTGAAVCNSF